MSHLRITFTVCSLGLLMWPCALAAQEKEGGPAHTFQELAGSVSGGQRIVITTSDGTQVRGRLERLDPALLILEAGGRTNEFRESDIREIRKRGDRLWNGGLIGAGGLAAVGAVWGGSRCSEDVGSCSSLGMFAGLGVGALLGVTVDALMPHNKVLYSRPETRAHEWTLEPFVTRRAGGVRVVVSM